MADDALKLLDNGHIEVTFNDLTYDCRRPKAKEYFELREQANVVYKEMPKKLEEADDTIQKDRITFESLGGWLLQVLKTLSTFTGELDDLPPWIIDGTATAAIMRHWVEVPLVLPGR